MLVPDVPITAGDGAARLRPLLREGFTLLLGRAPGGTGESAFAEAVRAVAARATSAPVAVHRIADLDTDGALARALEPGSGQAWLVRPDAHIAAVVDGTDPAAVHTALRTALGTAPVPPQTTPAEETGIRTTAP